MSKDALGAVGRALLLAVAIGTLPIPSFAAATDYRFDLVGKPEAAPDGGSTVTVRLVHVPDGVAVAGAVVFRVKADMGPAGMAGMAAPASLVGEAGPGLYRIA